MSRLIELPSGFCFAHKSPIVASAQKQDSTAKAGRAGARARVARQRAKEIPVSLVTIKFGGRSA